MKTRPLTLLTYSLSAMLLVAASAYGEEPGEGHIVPCKPLALQYDESGTCESEGKLQKDNDLVKEFAEQRKKAISQRVMDLLSKKIVKTTNDMARLDLLYSSLLVDEEGMQLSSLDHISACSVDEMKKRFKCPGSANIARIIGNDNFNALFESVKTSFVNSRIKAIDQGNTNRCISMPVLLEYEWNDSDREKLEKISVNELHKVLTSIKANELSLSDNDISLELIKYFPNLIKDLDSFILPSPQGFASSLDYLKQLIVNNDNTIKSKVAASCRQLEETIGEALCAKDVSPVSNNEEISVNIFGYTPQLTSFSQDEADFDDEPEKSYLHYATNCSAKHWQCEECLAIDEFVKEFINVKDSENSGVSTYEELLNSDPEYLGFSREDKKDMIGICQQINCANFEAMVAGKEKECRQRERLDPVALRSEFKCEPGSQDKVCSYIDIVERAYDRDRGGRRVSKFTRQVIGDEMADRIAGVATTDAEGNGVATNPNHNILTVDTGLSEDDVIDLETEYDRQAEQELLTEVRQGGERRSATPTGTKKRASAQAETKNGSLARGNSRRVAPVRQVSAREEGSEEKQRDETSGMTTESEEQLSEYREEIDELETIRDRLDEMKQEMATTKSAEPSSGEVSAPVQSKSVATTTSGRGRAPASTGEAAPSIIGSLPAAGAATPPSPDAGVGAVGDGAGASAATSSASSQGLAASGANGGARGAGGARINGLPVNAQGESFIDEAGEVIEQSIEVPDEGIEMLSMNYLEKNKITPTKPFVIYLKTKDGPVPVQVRVNRLGALSPVAGSNQAIMDELKKAPIFKDYFREVKRVQGLDKALRDLDLAAGM